MASCGGGKRPGRRALLALTAALTFLVQLLRQGHAARLYSSQDSVAVLEMDGARGLLLNSSSAWVVEFYSSWCGHCVSYAPTWKALARDVKDWELAIRVGVMDCADEKNFATCADYGIHFYPTFRYFKALATKFTTGENYKGPNRELQTVRQIMIDFLQNHTSVNKPPACPVLGVASSSSILSLLDKHQKHYTAVIFETELSYVGREVILDLMQYENIIVKRALDSDKKLMEKFGIHSVPSCYLFYPNGSHGSIYMQKPLRSFFSSYLKSLSGITKRLFSQNTVRQKEEITGLTKLWKDFDRSKVYMADLESGLHYLLRVELASHKILEGSELTTLKDFVTVLAKLFPGQQPVVKLLETLQEWLVSLPLDKIPYDAILDLVNNKMRISGIFLTNRIEWVGCQGSQPQYRGYPCSLWTLFHTLMVHAVTRPEMQILPGFDNSPQMVLQAIRRYIQHFFGCRECAQHFEEMAKESMDKVATLDDAILWLWRKHNDVNSRLAGAPSEDPMFPKVAWPTPDHCPRCHEEIQGLHTWKEEEVLAFLKSHYSVDNISFRYSEYELQTNKAKKAAPESNQNEGKKPVPPPLENGHRKQKGNPQNRGQNPRHGALIKPENDLADSNRKRVAFVQDAASLKKEFKQSISFFGIGFSNVDMSLCVMLYAASCLFLMIMYFYFQMRSKKWKARYVCPLV
ncbi:LIM/homeobox protein Lhx3 isoform X1 [Scyliorhinus canicula]|uniref:LIM/homeobox protein Lhx3 isoform X1 n=1 Tax=Scyliorhinus canicula TaxID=7830 RepID=UPI0018F532B4|nr:LIM/homeobox protein Lhx3 isoform X1 [Scyliorhinus canicula]